MSVRKINVYVNVNVQVNGYWARLRCVKVNFGVWKHFTFICEINQVHKKLWGKKTKTQAISMVFVAKQLALLSQTERISLSHHQSRRRVCKLLNYVKFYFLPKSKTETHVPAEQINEQECSSETLSVKNVKWRKSKRIVRLYLGIPRIALRISRFNEMECEIHTINLFGF